MSCNFKDFGTPCLLWDSEITVSTTVHTNWNLVLFHSPWSADCCFGDVCIILKFLCSLWKSSSVLYLRKTRQESGRNCPALLSNHVSCSLALNMWGQKFQVLSSRAHSTPVSCVFVRNHFPSSCCLPLKMGLMTLFLVQEVEKWTYRVAEVLSWKFRRRIDYILSAV